MEEPASSSFYIMTILMLLVFIMPGCLVYKVIMQAITKKEVSYFKCLFKTLLTIFVTFVVVIILSVLLHLAAN